MHYTTPITPHHGYNCNCTCKCTNYTALRLLHSSTTLQLQLQPQLQLQLHYTTLHPAVVVRWPLQPLQPLQKTQLQPPLGPSVDSLCHPWVTTTNHSYRFPIFETSATALCQYTWLLIQQPQHVHLVMPVPVVPKALVAALLSTASIGRTDDHGHFSRGWSLAAETVQCRALQEGQGSESGW